ncbi:hypothetical protein [Miniphocaeibacter massiliensis]|uniref:hypothetical protein n=1 Tax=Miniphocaeibacter massiliensis TaxID=2041841 RepID=UPI000C072669|nr:hypothetical protein [Miniphocaeibacter massiliensis]
MNKLNEILNDLAENFELYIQGKSDYKVENKIIFNLMELLVMDSENYKLISRQIRLFLSEIKISENYDEFIFRILVIKLYCDNLLKNNRINENNENILKRLKSATNENKSVLLYLAGSNYKNEDIRYKYLKEALKYHAFPNLLIDLSNHEKNIEIKKSLSIEAEKMKKTEMDIQIEDNNLFEFNRFYHTNILGDFIE